MGSKLGLHHLGQPDDTTRFLERRTPFAWRKQCAPGGDNPTPNIKTIGRTLTLTDGEANAMVTQGAWGAEIWYNRVRAQMLAARWVHCWELPNEPPVDSRLQCVNLGNFTRRAVDLMHADRLRVATGVFSRGRPQLAAALPSATYLRELQPCFDYGDYVALHAYWVRNPQQDAAWLQFRHRLLLKELAALGIKCKPILITESGLDDEGGWKNTNISEADYWTQLRGNDLALETDNEVLCCTPFTNQPTRDWEPYQITPWLTAKIAEEVRARPPEIEEETMPDETIKLVYPIRGPVFVTQEFGGHAVNYAPYPGHPGQDLRAEIGHPIRAAHDGVVYHDDSYGPDFGVYCWIKGQKDGKTWWTMYNHLSRVLADDKEEVKAGSIIALSGNSGTSTTGAHLDWRVETETPNPGYQDRLDKRYYWHDVREFLG
jgi:hypothetical protein